MDLAAELSACATTADLYRTQIAAENRMAPPEVMALAAQASALPEAARPWAEALAALCLRIRGEVQPYAHRVLGACASFYEAPGAQDGPRSLVVAFTGIAQRMMLPVAPFLQALPARRCDVVVLRDTQRTGFLAGVPDYAADLPALAARLEAELPMARYADRRCIGTSSGGAAALAFGALVGARVSLALAGAPPRGLTMREPPAGLDRQAFDRIFAAAREAPTRLVCAHGTDSIRDSIRSRLLALMVPSSTLLEVRGISVHGVLGGLVQRDLLPRFLDEMLLADAPPADGTWQA